MWKRRPPVVETPTDAWPLINVRSRSMGTRKDTPRSIPVRSADDGVDKGTADIRLQLSGHVEVLRYVVGTIGVCAQALNLQNADLDRDIALVLQRAAGDRLYETAERIEAMALGMEYEEA
jgi:hypothetical protein